MLTELEEYIENQRFRPTNPLVREGGCFESNRPEFFISPYGAVLAGFDL